MSPADASSMAAESCSRSSLLSALRCAGRSMAMRATPSDIWSVILPLSLIAVILPACWIICPICGQAPDPGCPNFELDYVFLSRSIYVYLSIQIAAGTQSKRRASGAKAEKGGWVYTIDIDTGGTFTDGYLTGPDRKVGVKVHTTPHGLTLCFWNCIESGARALDLPTEALLADTRVVRFSSTIATNAAVQLSGPKLGLIVTEGAEHTLYGAADNPLFAFLPTRLVAGLREQVDDAGVVKVAASPNEIEEKARGILEQGARMLVICLRNAHLNPANEIVVRKVL